MNTTLKARWSRKDKLLLIERLEMYVSAGLAIDRALAAAGTPCVLDGSVAAGIAVVPVGNVKPDSVEHPSGEFTVELEVDPANPQNVTRAALLRTARLIMRGEVLIPSSIWQGKQE